MQFDFLHSGKMSFHILMQQKVDGWGYLLTEINPRGLNEQNVNPWVKCNRGKLIFILFRLYWKVWLPEFIGILVFLYRTCSLSLYGLQHYILVEREACSLEKNCTALQYICLLETLWYDCEQSFLGIY